MKNCCRAVAVALCLALAMSPQVWATELTGEGMASTSFTATITPTILSVALPTEISFTMDPNRDIDLANGVTQVINPDNANVTNSSRVPIVLSIVAVNNVASKTEGVEFSLVPKLSEVVPGRAFLALRGAGESFQNEKELEQYALMPTGEGEKISIPVAKVDADSATVPLHVYGKIASNAQMGQFAFTVTPVLKVDCERLADSPKT